MGKLIQIFDMTSKKNGAAFQIVVRDQSEDEAQALAGSLADAMADQTGHTYDWNVSECSRTDNRVNFDTYLRQARDAAENFDRPPLEIPPVGPLKSVEGLRPGDIVEAITSGHVAGIYCLQQGRLYRVGRIEEGKYILPEKHTSSWGFAYFSFVARP